MKIVVITTRADTVAAMNNTQSMELLTRDQKKKSRTALLNVGFVARNKGRLPRNATGTQEVDQGSSSTSYGSLDADNMPIRGRRLLEEIYEETTAMAEDQVRDLYKEEELLLPFAAVRGLFDRFRCCSGQGCSGSDWVLSGFDFAVTNPVKTNAKIGLADSRVKRVQFTAKNSGTPGNQFEHIRRSEHRRDFRDSGSIESVRTQSGSRRWAQKTGKPNEISPGKLLLVGSVPLRIPVSDGSSLWESVGIEDEKTWSVMTGLGPSEASTGPSGY
ncbi:hypothetical protein E3N88_38241 [Mikania micrantha]|uniref:Uncharacterized protein n=1 Tax=Mikania micrantha TaxID=192012 RepID=A0A5N6LTF1_9ASTR|nr:hypothetical protein E3N88_38241 [Mikania micrantha]